MLDNGNAHDISGSPSALVGDGITMIVNGLRACLGGAQRRFPKQPAVMNYAPAGGLHKRP